MTGIRSGRPRRPEKDVVLDRDDDGRIYASLPYEVHHYGVEGFDWGYIGPGTAELSLNILHWLLPPGVDGEPPIQCEEDICSAVAWRLHRSFMAEFLVRVPYAGGCLKEAEIRRWVLQHIHMPEEPVKPSSGRGWLTSLIR
jgi:hypothetical protein